MGRQVEQISVAAQDLQKLSSGMVEAIDRISRIVEQNAAAMEENSAASQEVSASVEEMSAQVEETLTAAQSLADMSEEMERAVSVFKVGNRAEGK